MEKPTKLWNRDFILLLQGSLFSCLGDVIYSICIGFWVYEQTQSTALMGMVSSISMFLTLFLGPICGSIADRSDRKQLIVGADALRGIVMLLLGIAACMNQMNLTMVIVVALICAMCQVVFSPASMTVFADILPADELVRGQSISSGGASILSLIGKSLSGTIIVVMGVPMLLVVNGICYIFSAISECFIRVPHNPKQGQPINIKSIFADMKEGLRYSIRQHGLNTIMFSALFINLTASGIFSMMLPFCYEKGLTVVEYGWISSIFSVAGLIGMLVMGTWKIKKERRFLIMMAGFLGNGITFITGYLSGSFLTIGCFFFIGQFCNVIANAIFNAALILAVPRDKRGNVFGFITACSTGGSAISTVLYGALAEYFPISSLGIVGSLLSFIPFYFFFRNQNVRNLITESGEESVAE